VALANSPTNVCLELWIDGVRIGAVRPGGAFQLGRKEGNDYVVDDEQVSRRHAQVRWSKGAERPRLLDLGSANGTYLDGQPLVGEALLERDKGTILIGETLILFSCEVSTSDVLARAYNLPDDSGEFTLENRDDILGVFETFEDLKDMLLGLERAQRSGRLSLFRGEGGDPIFELTFAEGRVMGALRGRLDGLNALDRLSDIKRGHYRFSGLVKPGGEFLDLSISAYLNRGF
jgi:hypothetical protein